MPYMSTKLTCKTSSTSAEETKLLARKIGKLLKGGEIFVLIGDLGFGKTQFVKGLVDGAGIKEEATSPSFTITNVYKGDNFTIHHMDYYRITEPGVLKDELIEIINDKNNVVVIEWPEIMLDYLPENSITINIANLGNDNREITFKYKNEHRYLLEDLL